MFAEAIPLGRLASRIRDALSLPTLWGRYPMSDRWKTPWPAEGEANPDILYRAVGEALTCWETVEQALAQIFAFVTSNDAELDRSRPAIRAYGMITGAHQRISMTRSAIESWFHQHSSLSGLDVEELNAAGMALLSEIGTAASRRNDIAHGRVDSLADVRKNGWYLFPGLFSTSKRPLSGSPRYRYNADNISFYGRGFLELHRESIEFLGVIVEWHKIAGRAFVQRLAKDPSNFS